ncbi:methyltransferase domain-containing protein [Rhizobium sp. SG2393]|uniref:methyltransferase domain-containing protein n=1 Tax=Rhizobium sp. SG2393 TaxID=3276279 RepID=UPI003672D511
MSSDRLFDDVFLSEIYDAWHPRGVRDDFDFYMPLIMRARSVLDIGCGTGTLLDEARRSGHRGLLCGIDPGAGVLSRAYAFPDVEWVEGTLPRPDWTARFDLAVMTGHAFQAILSDADVDAFLCGVRECLEPGGLFAFETRNPLVRPWERWTPDRPALVCLKDGTEVTIVTTVTAAFDGHTIAFRHDFLGNHPALPLISESRLRFLDAAALAQRVSECGFVIEALYGDFQARPLTAESPEIIILARRA